MAKSSLDRVAAGLRRIPETELSRIAAAREAPRLPVFAERRFGIIAEIKKRSPSAGELSDGSTGCPREQAVSYRAGGATALSVLTEPTRFGGALDDMLEARAAAELPVMRKDFLVDPYQVLEARAHGADGVLLIVKILSDHVLCEMLETVRMAGMFALIESFDEQDIARCEVVDDIMGPADLLGLNCRDLRTLEVDFNRFTELADSFPPGARVIAESGIQSAAEVARLRELGYGGALVGTALMRSADPARVLDEMLGAGQRATT